MHNSSFKTAPIPYNESLAINFLYKTIPGRVLLGLLVRPFISKLVGAFMDSVISKIFISGFIRKNEINIEDYEKTVYSSFNDFFVRQVKKGSRPFSFENVDAVAPCDGMLTAYKITPDSSFHIKNSIYSIEELLCDEALADDFMGGTCLIFRLAPTNYHRYAYTDDGEILLRKNIQGKLHTVRPIAQLGESVFARNARKYELVDTRNFEKVVQMEVGALFVGRIKNQKTATSVKRGQEKGMFEFGGSTVIMLYQKDTLVVNPEIFENTAKDLETIVEMGVTIGESLPVDL